MKSTKKCDIVLSEEQRGLFQEAPGEFGGRIAVPDLNDLDFLNDSELDEILRLTQPQQTAFQPELYGMQQAFGRHAAIDSQWMQDLQRVQQPEGQPAAEAQQAAFEPKPKRRAGKIISAVLFYGFLVVLILAALLLSRGAKEGVLGYSFMYVKTWSMQSVIPQGSLIVVKKTDAADIKIGDDISYMKDAETTVTHRVIGIIEDLEESGERGFETQGVDVDTPDFEIVPAVNVIGVVQFHIPVVGEWLAWLGENIVITLAFLAGIVLLLFLLRGAFKKSPSDKNKKPQPQKTGR